MVVLYNVTEEFGFTGFLFARLQDRHGPMRAALVTTVFFWLFHLPTFVIDTGSWALAALLMGIVLLPHFASRVIAGWLYNAAGASVLIAGLFHATFNSTINPSGFAVAVLDLPRRCSSSSWGSRSSSELSSPLRREGDSVSPRRARPNLHRQRSRTEPPRTASTCPKACTRAACRGAVRSAPAPSPVPLTAHPVPRDPVRSAPPHAAEAARSPRRTLLPGPATAHPVPRDPVRFARAPCRGAVRSAPHPPPVPRQRTPCPRPRPAPPAPCRGGSA